MKQKIAWLELILTEGLGVGTAYKLVQEFGQPLGFLEHKKKIDQMLTSKAAHNLWDKKFFNHDLTIDQILEVLEKQNIKMITVLDDDYPESLKNQKNPPVTLFLKGKLPLQKSFAIVGTRNLSDYGKSVTQKIAREIAAAGFIVVSGLAMGADAVAHTAAVLERTPTIAVLGTSVDKIYPVVNNGLARKILEFGGGLVSENPPGTIGGAWLFPARNRIIAGLSCGVLVTEGKKNSGALITAKFGMEQGKNIYAIPGDINRVQASGPNQLISQGAKLVSCGQDILEDYGYLPRSLDDVKKPKKFSDVYQEKVYHIIAKNSKISFDSILLATKYDFGTLSATLMQLELSGDINKLSGSNYCKS